MSTHPDGGPAFPHAVSKGSPFERLFDGMSLRDYFAAKALHVVSANGAWANESDYRDQIAARCYEMADAMLKQRSK